MLFWLFSFEGWWRVMRPAPDTTVNTFNSRARCRQRPLIRTAVVYIPCENYRTYLQKTVMTNLMYINWIFKYGNNSLCVLQICQWLFWLMKVLFCSVTICHVCNLSFDALYTAKTALQLVLCNIHAQALAVKLISRNIFSHPVIGLSDGH